MAVGRKIVNINSVSNRLWKGRVSSSKRPDEVKSGTVVGADNKRGSTKVKLTGSAVNVNVFNNQSNPATYGRSVTINRSNSRRGGRRVSVTTTRKISTNSESDARLTQAYEDTTTNLTGCTDNDPSPFQPEPPEPPEAPEPEPTPDPPEAGPNDPEQPPEQPPTPNGCNPEDEDQWYNAAGPGAEFCPAGTQYKGFAEVPEGTFMVLCGGPARPPGDGCPEEPISYSCYQGSCREVPNGTFASIEDCQATDCSESGMGFVCVSGSCEPVPLSQAIYATQEECLANCDSPPAPGAFDCVNGQCLAVEGGAFTDINDCRFNCDQGCGTLDYEFFNVTTQEFDPISRQVCTPFTVTGVQMEGCDGGSVCCIKAVWDTGEVSLTASSFPAFCSQIAVRNLVFTPN